MATLIPIVRRIVYARVKDPAVADDLVQETLARVLAAAERVEPGMLEPYAIVTARNVVASMWQEQDRQRRNQHRVVDLRPPELPDEQILAEEERRAVTQALGRLDERERATLVAHEVAGQDTRSLADEAGSTSGAVAARLHRARARMRVEYLLALEQAEPQSDRCRPVLLAVSASDRRRQRELEAARHLLECELCGRLSKPLMQRAQPREGELRIVVEGDADIVAARQAAREFALRAGFVGAAPTLVATAVSEVARNIVRFAGRGEVMVEEVDSPRPGVRVTATDAGPGITDIDQAMQDGYSTYNGLGIGLSGARRLMDEFAVVSEVGHGTTLTMTKYLPGG